MIDDMLQRPELEQIEPEQAEPEQAESGTLSTREDALSFCSIFDQILSETIDVIDNETKSLKEMNIVEAELLQAKKNDLMNKLHQITVLFKKYREDINLLAADVIEPLAEKHQMLRQSIAVNMDMLKVLHSVSESLIHKTLEGVSTRSGQSLTYANDANHASQPSHLSIAIDHRL